MSNVDKIIIVDYVTKKPGFTAVYNDFLDVPGKLISGDEKIIYILLLRYWNKDKKISYPSIATLMEKTNWGNQKVIKLIKSLEDKKLLVKKSNFCNTKKNNEYILYDVEYVQAGNNEETKKEFFVSVLNERLKKASDNDEDFFKYVPLESLLNEISKKDKVEISNKEISIEDYLEKISALTIEQMLDVIDRVNNLYGDGKIKNRYKYLLRCLYEEPAAAAPFI